LLAYMIASLLKHHVSLIVVAIAHAFLAKMRRFRDDEGSFIGAISNPL